MEQHSTTPLRLRVVADEAWALVEGKVEFVWWDLRAGSPTKNGTHRLLASEPTLVMTPFGVAFGVRVLETSSLLVRATTHDEGEHAGDRILRWEDLP
jgi:dTDP-4-dehydrorhamnose 3,5-epimerase-like enzyme